MFGLRRSFSLVQAVKRVANPSAAKSFNIAQRNAVLTLINLRSRTFSSAEQPESDKEGSHSDFAPQTKAKITNENVMEQIDQVDLCCNYSLIEIIVG